MQLKTMHLTNYWHGTSGGIATFYRALIEEANRRGQPIRLVVPGEQDGVEQVGAHGRIYYLQAPRSRLNPAYRTIYPSQFLLAGSKLQAILMDERPDLVEICDKYTLNYLGAVLRMRLLRNIDFRPIVVGLSCERMDDNFRSYVGNPWYGPKFCSFYMKRIYFPFFDHHVANSAYTSEELQLASRHQLTSRSVWVRPMGVDLNHLSPGRRSPDLRRRLLENFGAPPESTLLLYVGRLAPEKNLELLFQTVSHLARDPEQDFRLLVIGDGIERARWEAETTRVSRSRVLFDGHLTDRQALANIYANADVFIHPNPREPFGIAPLEAMASGLPLVAPDSGGVTSYANSENAWTVEPTLESFSHAIREASLKSELKRKKVENALATVESYRWETVAAGFLDLYSEFQRAAHGQQLLAQPDFQSTGASRVQKAVLHVASQAAHRAFVVGADLISMTRGGSRRTDFGTSKRSPLALRFKARS